MSCSCGYPGRCLWQWSLHRTLFWVCTAYNMWCKITNPISQSREVYLQYDVFTVCAHVADYIIHVLGPIYNQDRILQVMDNVTLAFHLLCERANPVSFWLPYIRSLPQVYNTPLYYEQEEVQLLLGTQAVHDILNQYRNTARQYAYFYKLIQVGVLIINEWFVFTLLWVCPGIMHSSHLETPKRTLGTMVTHRRTKWL